MHSKHFERVKGYFERGLWTEARVKRAVCCRWITEEELHAIVGGAVTP